MRNDPWFCIPRGLLDSRVTLGFPYDSSFHFLMNMMNNNNIFLIKIFLNGFLEEIFPKGVFLQGIFLLIYFQGIHSKSFFPRHLCQRFCVLRYFCKGVISLQGVFSKKKNSKVFLQSRFFAMGFFQRVFLQMSFFSKVFI